MELGMGVMVESCDSQVPVPSPPLHLKVKKEKERREKTKGGNLLLFKLILSVLSDTCWF